MSGTLAKLIKCGITKIEDMRDIQYTQMHGILVVGCNVYNNNMKVFTDV